MTKNKDLLDRVKPRLANLKRMVQSAIEKGTDMPKWTKPEEKMPSVHVGDRIVIMVAERQSPHVRKKPRLVIIEATEDGWKSNDPVYVGYGPEDGILWAPESDV